MKQIRLCWRPDVVGHEYPPSLCAGEWMEADFDARRHMRRVLKLALEAGGPGSHWVEKREAPAPLVINQDRLP